MRHRLLLLIVLVSVVRCPGARAQVHEYTLDPEAGQWVRQTPDPDPGTDEAVIAETRELLAAGRYSEAYRRIHPWVESNERSDHPALAEAFVLRGDALTAVGREYKALYDYEAVIKGFPATPQYVRAVERELEIGTRYVNGLRRRLLGMRIVNATDVGEELLIRVQERLPSSRLAERAGIELADYYYRVSDMEMAAEAYRLFIENYPRSAYLPKAMKRRIYANIARFKGPEYDASPLIDATVLVRRFAMMYPAEAEKAGLDDALVARLNESAAAEMFTTARWYLRTGDPVSARYTLGRLIEAHPRTASAQMALDLMERQGWEPAAAEPGHRPIAPAPDEPAATAPPTPAERVRRSQPAPSESPRREALPSAPAPPVRSPAPPTPRPPEPAADQPGVPVPAPAPAEAPPRRRFVPGRPIQPRTATAEGEGR
ncbi:MAG TPA: outer membrane protein assembly factor BamD [Phycisphaerales bacterium]|nr:outer membrane protein assembly factor BamD [Phycisphaerales bacterium]